MGVDRTHLLALLEIPHLHRIIGACAGEQVTAAEPADVEHVVRVSLERLDELAAGQLEDLDELVGAAAGNHLAVGAEADAVDGITVTALDLLHEVPAADLEYLHFAVLR